MTSILLRTAGFALATSLAVPVMAQDAPDPGSANKQSVEVSAETQEFSGGYGSLRSVKIEYRADFADTTVTFSPTVGERRVSGDSRTSVGGAVTVYHDFSDDFSTRSRVFVSENQPVFATLDLAQDFTVRLAEGTSGTIGVRWAEYYGGDDVFFLSGGLRQYFRGGSVAYRLTRVKPAGRDAFLAQLVNLTINDPHGHGKTQLWANYGGASFDRTIDSSFTGKDYGGAIQRIQPLDQSLSLSLSAGLQSYARPAGRITGTKLGLGLQYAIDGER